MSCAIKYYKLLIMKLLYKATPQARIYINLIISIIVLNSTKNKYLPISSLRTLPTLYDPCPVKYPYMIFALQKFHGVNVKHLFKVVTHTPTLELKCSWSSDF